jgi:SAM-dependent methyltransferase
MSIDLARVEREKLAHNEGLKRGRYEAVLKHAGFLFEQRRLRIIGKILQARSGQEFLELGSGSWHRWIAENQVRPKRLVCINISEAEIEKGKRYAGAFHLDPEFRLMDANQLDFPDASFDVVFGSGILHHLEYERALEEVARVLRPGGLAIFHEPLNINPVGKLVRALTPAARTADERPLQGRELRVMKKLFDTEFYYEQFFAVPAGVISKLIFRTGDNPLTRSAAAVDQALLKMVPVLGPLYRHVLMAGVKRP